jgi:hypothetical protein
VTSHTVVYNGKVASLFTPHSDCLNLESFSQTNNGSYILDNTYDLAIDLNCKDSVSSALDISSVFEPSLGDEIVAFGYGEIGFVWQGLVAGRITGNCSGAATHWVRSPRTCIGEIVAQGHQHDGMSGAAILNGCGYVGMAHAMTIGNANYAYIIPASAIIRLIKQHEMRLPTLEECRKDVLSPPLAALSSCGQQRDSSCGWQRDSSCDG